MFKMIEVEVVSGRMHQEEVTMMRFDEQHIINRIKGAYDVTYTQEDLVVTHSSEYVFVNCEVSDSVGYIAQVMWVGKKEDWLGSPLV